MSKYIEEYKFEETPKEITYGNEEPLKLDKDFEFFHNKSRFRKYLNPLQYMFKDYIGKTLLAVGIRDTYLKEEYSKDHLIVIFTKPETIKGANSILEGLIGKSFNPGTYHIKSTSSYMALIAKDMDGITSGLTLMEDILTQTLEDYVSQKNFDDFVKIRPFELTN